MLLDKEIKILKTVIVHGNKIHCILRSVFIIIRKTCFILVLFHVIQLYKKSTIRSIL